MMVSSAASHGCTEGPEATYTLLDVVENAMCHNPKTRAAWANVKAQAAQVGVAKAAYLPTLSGSVQAIKDKSTSQGTNVVPFYVASDSTYHNDTLTLNWVLYDFGLRSATVDNAEKMLISAMASQDNVLQTVFATAVKDYYAALVAQKNIQATIDIETDAKHVLEAAVVRVQKGVAAISDQLQAKTAYSQAVFNRNKAEGDWQSALGTLAIDMGQRPDGSVVLIESDNAALPESELVQSVGELLQSAQKVHPSLIAARADVEAAQANEQMIRAQGRPSISMVGRYNANNQSQSSGVGQPYIGANGRDRYIGVQVDIPFFEGFSRTYKIRTAQAQVEGKEANLADAELQVAVNVWTSYQSLKVSAENLHTSQDILDSAHDAFKAAESRYQKGVANILEVLTTQTALANAQQQRIQAIASWQNARIQLAASVGNLNLSTMR
ncbi:TolC family protein [Collimonas pratensis]|uniref:Protein CyaE n=1 Tax=Collimonas pratensis TaxID=279113 RepID=A0ABN4MCZ4_9BURK|nr:TolC family protein [Collimonas pratensis]AMP15764.1 outer membrane efflux family protein [Collimonas pratensis]